MFLIQNSAHDYELIGNGVAYGYLPKVGNKGLLIIRKLYDGKWNFQFDINVRDWIGDSQVDFQTWDGKNYEWFHGCVDKNGKITQIG